MLRSESGLRRRAELPAALGLGAVAGGGGRDGDGFRSLEAEGDGRDDDRGMTAAVWEGIAAIGEVVGWGGVKAASGLGSWDSGEAGRKIAVGGGFLSTLCLCTQHHRLQKTNSQSK